MQMHEKNLKRFNIYAIIAKVLFIFTVIMGVIATLASIVAQIVVIISGEKIVSFIQQLVTERGFDYIIPFHTVPPLMVLTLIISGLTGIALTAYLLRAVSKLFKNIVETKTPFHPDNIRRVRAMGISLFIYTGVQFGLRILMSVQAEILLDTGSLPDGLSVKWAFIGFGVLLLALAEIFEFGSNLQQDNASIV